MGDHADDAVANAIDVWSGAGTYSTARCRYCGNTAVRWHLTPYGWRLHDFTGQPHRCNAYLTRGMAAAPTTDGATG